jgi:short-subunit dehydrogenase
MKKNSFNLKNKNIIITGGNGFLGSQITEVLIEEEANVFIIDIQKSKKKNSAKQFYSDITKENELKKILNYFKLKKIQIDVLINNAAISVKFR